VASNIALKIDLFGLMAMPSFKFKGSNRNKFKTLLTQEILRCGFLGATSYYASMSHSNEVLEVRYDALLPVFQNICRCEEGMDLRNLEQSRTTPWISKIKIWGERI